MVPREYERSEPIVNCVGLDVTETVRDRYSSSFDPSEYLFDAISVAMASSVGGEATS
jgi:hypothetical protein